jgi:hypothetical protein
MISLDLFKDIAQIVYYLSLSISGPLALIGYLRAKRAEQREREYKAYDELDNKFLDYQKLALQHDLDLLDLPDASLYLSGDRLRKKHELVTASCGFALFQRAFLMFRDQSGEIERRQWRGWERLLTSFLSRLSAQDAWQVCKLHFDTAFQAFVDDKLVTILEEAGTDSAIIQAFQTTGLLIRDHNEHLMSEEERAIWRAAIQEQEENKAA